MAADASKTTIDMTELDDLSPLAKRLNAATDEFNQVLESIQERLNALALGVEAWLDDGNHELIRRVVSTWGELDGHPVTGWAESEGRYVVQHRTVQVQELGYGRLGDGWGLLVRTVNYPEVKDTNPPYGWAVPDGEAATEEDRKSLLRSSRQLRVKAVDFIPDLVETLRSESARVIDAVEKAKKIAESLK